MVFYHRGKMVDRPNTMGQNEAARIVDSLIDRGLTFRTCDISCDNNRAIVSIHDGHTYDFERE